MSRPKGSKNKKPPVNPAKSGRGKRTKTAPTASQGQVATGHNGSPEDEAKRTLFFQHRPTWLDAQAKLKVALKRIADVKAALKADGLLVKEFQVADDLGTLKGEAKVVESVTLRRRVARWLGHPLGSQLDLFDRPNKPTLSVLDQAREDGKVSAMSHETPKPPHAPKTEAYRVWMQAYHDEQAKQVRAGIKPTEPPDNANGWGASKLPAVAQTDPEM